VGARSLLHMGEVASYQGGSFFLRWWPAMLVACALGVVLVGWSHRVQWATLLVLVAAVHGRWLPWQFTIRCDGIALRFPFGRSRFLPKSKLSIRLDVVGAIALVGRRRRFGYPLLDRVLYAPGHDEMMRTTFSELGYELA